MRSAVLELTWYQYFLLDVMAVLTLAAGSAVLVVFLMVRRVLRKFSASNNINMCKKKRG
jgi:hypothetical protein